MKTKYGIPQEELDKIVERDKNCVYCHKPWNLKNRRSIEHLNHRWDWDSVGDFVSKGWPVFPIIAICCVNCNSSRSDKKISKWINEDKSGYCKRNNISFKSIAPVVREYIQKYEN